MTLATTTPKVTYDTDGATLAFDFTFKMWAAGVSSELAVIFNEDEDDEATLVVDTDYTLSAPNNDYSSGGTVTLATGSAYAANGNTITIKSALAVEQELEIPYTGGFPPKSVEYQFDKVIRIIQQIVLDGGISSTAASAYIETLLNDASAAEARRTLGIYSYDEILVHNNEILFYGNEIVFNV